MGVKHWKGPRGTAMGNREWWRLTEKTAQLGKEVLVMHWGWQGAPEAVE